MDQEELRKLREKSKLEERYGHLVEEYEENPEEEEPMKVHGESLRDVHRQQAKREAEK